MENTKKNIVTEEHLDRLITESIHKLIKERENSSKEQVNEAMRFNFRGFLGELAMLMKKYKVNLTDNAGKCLIEDEYGNTVLDFTNKSVSPDTMMRLAVKAK